VGWNIFLSISFSSICNVPCDWLVEEVDTIIREAHTSRHPTQGSLQWSQNPVTGPYPGPVNPVHTFPSYFFSMYSIKIHFNITLSPTHVFQVTFSFRFPTKMLSAFLTSLIRATCPAHPTILNSITRIMISEVITAKIQMLIFWVLWRLQYGGNAFFQNTG
jgi:hypothetical protein